MRQKTLKTVVTFASTAISAGCGLAWCAEQQDRSALVEALNAHALAYEGIHEVELY
jgi:hypothetical protein